MAKSELERMLDEWAIAWSSSESSDPGRVLTLFALDRAFAAVPDFKYRVTSRFASSKWAVIEWVMSGTHKGDFPGIPATGKRFSSVRGLDHPGTRRRQDPPRV